MKTLGPQPHDVHRIAGMAAAWGQSTDVATGEALKLTQLVRASIGYPVPWSVAVWIDGNPPGILPPGTKINVSVQPGLGRGGVAKGLPFNIQTDPIAFVTFCGSPFIPATEMIVSVDCAIVALAPYRVCAVACPAMWVPTAHARPQG